MAAHRARQFLLLAVTFGVIGLACNGGDDDDQETETPTPIPSPIFPSLVVPIFYNQCGATRAECHTRTTFVANSAAGCTGFLALEDAMLGSVYYTGTSAGLPTGCPDLSLYDRLLTLASQCIGTPGEWSRPHVFPGVYSSSYLFSKIAGGPYCLLTNGEPSLPMPLDHAITGEDIDAIRDWINDGAPEN